MFPPCRGCALPLRPRVRGDVLQPGYLVQILHTIPARKIVQCPERATADPVLLIRQVGGDSLVKAGHRFCETQLMQIPHHIRVGGPARVPGQLTAQRQVALVIQVILLQFKRSTGEERRGAEIAGRHAHGHRRVLPQRPDLGFRLAPGVAGLHT
jgi:hypothetical protein